MENTLSMYFPKENIRQTDSLQAIADTSANGKKSGAVFTTLHFICYFLSA